MHLQKHKHVLYMYMYYTEDTNERYISTLDRASHITWEQLHDYA